MDEVLFLYDFTGFHVSFQRCRCITVLEKTPRNSPHQRLFATPLDVAVGLGSLEWKLVPEKKGGIGSIRSHPIGNIYTRCVGGIYC